MLLIVLCFFESCPYVTVADTGEVLDDSIRPRWSMPTPLGLTTYRPTSPFTGMINRNASVAGAYAAYGVPAAGFSIRAYWNALVLNLATALLILPLRPDSVLKANASMLAASILRAVRL